jgi:hypothetical protein
MKLLKRILAAIRGKSQESDRKCCEVGFTGTVPTFGEEKFIIRNNNFAEFSWKPRYRYDERTGVTTGPSPNFVVDKGAGQYVPSRRNQNQYTGQVVNWPVFPIMDSREEKQKMIDQLMISEWTKRLHRVDLKKDGSRFIGIYNDLSSWGLVFDDQGIKHQTLYAGWDEEEQELANFCADSFTMLGGYEIV